MNKNIKKLIAPIIITIVGVVWLALLVITYSLIILPIIFKIIICLIPILLIFVSIAVLIERIKEIRSGEEDDLSKY